MFYVSNEPVELKVDDTFTLGSIDATIVEIDPMNKYVKVSHRDYFIAELIFDGSLWWPKNSTSHYTINNKDYYFDGDKLMRLGRPTVLRLGYKVTRNGKPHTVISFGTMWRGNSPIQFQSSDRMDADAMVIMNDLTLQTTVLFVNPRHRTNEIEIVVSISDDQNRYAGVPYNHTGVDEITWR